MKLEFSKPPALVFVQETMKSGFRLYVDGEYMPVRAVKIDAEAGKVTECLITLIPGVKQYIEETEE